MRRSRAPATRRAYRIAWKAWATWAALHREPELPAHPEAIAAYLAARAEAGAGRATLDMARAAIAAALDSQALAAIRATTGRHARTSPRAARDMALVSVMADAGLRITEAAALLWTDIAPAPDGSGRLTIRRSKTDQTGEGAVVAITAAAASDLCCLRRFRPPEDESVFGIGPRQIARRIAAVAKAADLGTGWSGHSGRVGMAVRMTRHGAPAAAVMRQGRWASSRMVARYTRSEAAGEALRYL